jgi:DeoR/GlpR family transcriptional regulator of sugar metabolism
MAEGTIRIESLAEQFGTSLMTVHRDLDELASRGLLRKDRGVATAVSSVLVESSDVYRSSRQLAEKEAIAHAAVDFVEPGQAIILDDSTSTLSVVNHLAPKAPLTVITNAVTILERLRGAGRISIIGLGGQYFSWCSAFMGRMTRDQLAGIRADLVIMSTAAVTDDVAFHQAIETVDVKRAMFESARRRILLIDHTKFERRALHAMLPLAAFDAVIVDSLTDRRHITRLEKAGVRVIVARVGQQR